MEAEISREQLLQALVLENDDKARAQSGCYVKNPTYLEMVAKPLAVPLRHMDYQVSIAGSIAQVRLEQHYENPLDALLELEYMLPIEPSACVTSFKAIFDDHEIVGMIKEKQAAKEEYQKGFQQGRQVAYGEINERSRDIMVLKIGNVAPKGKVRI